MLESKITFPDNDPLDCVHDLFCLSTASSLFSVGFLERSLIVTDGVRKIELFLGKS